MPRTFVSSAALPRRSSASVIKKLAVLVILLTAVGSMVSGQPNDDFINRTVIGSEDGAVRGSNLLASKEAGEPNHAGDSGGRSVWWTWTPTTNGTVEISTVGSEFDTVLGVYTGTSVGDLTRLASNNDGGGNRTSLVRFSVIVS